MIEGIADFAEDLFQQVFQGDQTSRAAVFVQNDGDVLAPILEMLQLGADRDRLWDVDRFAHQGAGRASFPPRLLHEA